MAKGITKRSEDYSKWYLDIVEKADLAENSPVRGCMVIKPYGYALWENIKSILNQNIVATGHQNAYFPLFVPLSTFAKEAAHIKGFAKECAVVTHHRLIETSEGDGVMLDPDSKLSDPVIVRPTSETIIYETYSKWIKSWRDLPLLINQWANIVRWEMRTRPFLRTTEFLWQEGHTAHETEEEAEEEALKMLDVYADLAENCMAMPVIKGLKPEHDKFPGALRTYAIEAMMQDGKALQSGTSHNLGQNFSKPFNIKYLDKDGKEKYVWQTSWGVSTRLVGGLIMAHSDDKGLVLPPRIAPIQCVIVPIWKSDEEKKMVLEQANKLSNELCNECLCVSLDDREEVTPGFKFNEWELKGVPIRIELGPKDIEKGQVVLVRRDSGEKKEVKESEVAQAIKNLLEEIQKALFEKAKKQMDENTIEAGSEEELKAGIKENKFVWAKWDEKVETAERIQKETKATIRLVPTEGDKDKVLWAKAY